MSDISLWSLAAARDRMALIVNADASAVNGRIGSLTLRPHQRAAVMRLLDIIARYRGALLADAVGLGKTYVALAIAREHARPLVICPAALRAMWDRASSTANIHVPIMSIESLSRGDRPPFEPDIVIVDEAHHLRTPSTRRYEAIAWIAHRSRVLLMSATPLHNSRRDLTAILALFLGSAVRAWTDLEIARVIVRRDEQTAAQSLPALDGPHPLCPGADDDCLDAICTLPCAVPAADEGVAQALAIISMVHLWASSRAALSASLRKRRARALALKEAIASGHLPTAAELSAWHYADETLQLAFPFCVGLADGHDPIDIPRVSARLDEYIVATGRLIARCRESPGPDLARANLLRTLRAAYPEARIVAFSQYAQTVTALGRLLRDDPGIACVTASGARIASGLVTRQEVLAQFAGDADPVPVIERVDLLISTDLLSEGVDLRAASVIVHLDLPWNPARLEQRVGRARRIGSRHQAIHVYTLVPPAAAERMLDIEQRLSAKVQMADGVLGGISHMALPMNDRVKSASFPPVAAAELLRARLSGWIDPVARRESFSPVVAGASAPVHGWIAVAHLDGLPRLIHSVDDGVGEDPTAFLRLVDLAGDEDDVDPGALATVLDQIARWLSSTHLVADIGAEAAYPQAKRDVLDRLARSVSRAPRHRRASVLAAAQRARAGVSSVAGIGAERILEELARSVADDDAWIHSVEAFGALHGSSANRDLDRPGATADRAIDVLILLSPPSRR